MTIIVANILICFGLDAFQIFSVGQMSIPVPELRIENVKIVINFIIYPNKTKLSLPQTFASCLRLGHIDVSNSVVTKVSDTCMSDTLLSSGKRS